jgi:hypothetical protein
MSFGNTAGCFSQAWKLPALVSTTAQGLKPSCFASKEIRGLQSELTSIEQRSKPQQTPLSEDVTAFVRSLGTAHRREASGPNAIWEADQRWSYLSSREYEFRVGTIAGVAKKLRIHRRMAREAIGSAVPAARKKGGEATVEIGNGDGIGRACGRAALTGCSRRLNWREEF